MKDRETLADRVPNIQRIQEKAVKNFRENMSWILRGSSGGPGLGGVSKATGISQGDLWLLTWPPENLKLDSLSYDVVNKIAYTIGKSGDDLLTRTSKR